MSYLNEDLFDLNEDPLLYTDNIETEAPCGRSGSSMIHSLYYVNHIRSELKNNEEAKSEHGLSESQLINISMDYSS